MKYKLIVSDFDDTILRSDYTYSSDFVSAVKEYEAAGGKFVIATGRMTNVMRDVCLELDFSGELITYQGAVVSDIQDGSLLRYTPIAGEDAAVIGKYLEEKGVFYQLYTSKTVKDGQGFRQIEAVIADGHSEYSKLYAKLSNSPLIDSKQPLSEYILEEGISPIKLMIMAKPALVDGYIKELRALFADKFLINTSKEWLVEMISKEASKGIAVDWVAKKSGIKQSEVICIGDSLNDVPMLEWAGLSAAVANGSEAAKAVADIIAPSNDDDGVAYIIRKYGLNNL